MSVYTKKGDKGETSLYGGTRLSKDSARVWCYGTVDEANSVMGVLYATLEFDELRQTVRDIQKNLFTVGAQLASDEAGLNKLRVKITGADVDALEAIIDDYTKEYGGVSGFAIPGDTVSSSLLHVARTTVRRAERYTVSLSELEYVDPILLKYLNRLSDTLFVLSRVEAILSLIRKVSKIIISMVEEKTGRNSMINHELYEKMAEAVRLESERINVPVSFAITDENGSLQYFKRLPGTLLVSTSLAQNKAYTACSLKMSSAEFAPLALPSGPLFGINVSDPKLVTFGGGLLLKKDGEIVGAVGVSGGSVEEDIQIAQKAVDVFERS